MRNPGKDRMIRIVAAQIDLFNELRECLVQKESLCVDDACYCFETMKKVENGIRQLRLWSKDFGEFKDVAYCSMINRI